MTSESSSTPAARTSGVPPVGASVHFHQGIERNGTVIAVGPKRVHVKFKYRNGSEGVAKIPISKAIKNVGYGWSARPYWKIAT